jgi:hypothetical protein
MRNNDSVLRPTSLVGAARDGDADADEMTETAERRKFTQRMPERLVADIDEFADRHGISRNAAINMLAKEGLGRF